MEELEELILKDYRNILCKLGLEDIEIEIGTGFYSYPSINTIEIPIFETNPEGAKYFYNDFIKRLGTNECSLETASFLHELGHIQTYKKINDIIYCILAPIISFIQNHFENEKIFCLMQKIYFNLPLQKRATEWAIKTLKENQKYFNKLLTN